MADSIRKRVVAAYIARLETITTGNGYRTDLGLKITQWRTTDWQESELISGPGADVRDKEDPPTVKGRSHRYKLEIETDARMLGSTMKDVAHDILADILDAIATDLGFGGLVQMVEIGDSDVDFDQKNRKLGTTQLTVTLSYVTNLFSPDVLARQ
jgi:hypothetical protein